MRSYLIAFLAVLGTTGGACSTEVTDSGADTADLSSELSEYALAVDDDVTDDIVDTIFEDDDALLGDVDADVDEDIDEAIDEDSDGGIDERGGHGSRRHPGRRNLREGADRCARLVARFADPEDLQACQELRDTCTEAEDVCRAMTRQCVADLRDEAFAAACETGIAECEAVATTDGECDRIEQVCATVSSSASSSAITTPE